MRPVIDHGRSIDWGATSRDYATFRPGPPNEFYDRLQVHGIGLPGQRVLDLGTGTGWSHVRSRDGALGSLESMFRRDRFKKPAGLPRLNNLRSTFGSHPPRSRRLQTAASMQPRQTSASFTSMRNARSARSGESCLPAAAS
jgi:hypothetical protein